MKHQIVTSPDLIRTLGKSLYTNRLDFILVRELLQNAIDASINKEEINIVFNWKDNNTFELMVRDNGIGMTEEILLNVFLSIGSSYKPDNGSTGGFGIAKVALFSCNKWSVHTLDNYIDETLEHRKIEFHQGTIVNATIQLESNTYNWHKQDVIRLVHSNARENIILNGAQVESYNDIKIIKESKTEHGIDYTFGISQVGIENEYGWNENSKFGSIVYRINGLTQFIQDGNNELREKHRNLVIDFKGIGYTSPRNNTYPLSLSRESINDSGLKTLVGDWLNSLAKDVNSQIQRTEENKELKTEWINERTGLISRSSNGKLYKPQTMERRIVNLWKNIIETIKSDINWSFAVTNDETTKAFFQRAYGKNIVGINAQVVLEELRYEIEGKDTNSIIMYLWHMAVHEISHYYCNGHDENFSSRENDIALKSAWKMTENSHELKRLARKLFE